MLWIVRLSLGTTLAAIARRLGVAAGTYRLWECGEAIPNDGNRQRILEHVADACNNLKFLDENIRLPNNRTGAITQTKEIGVLNPSGRYYDIYRLNSSLEYLNGVNKIIYSDVELWLIEELEIGTGADRQSRQAIN